jgi:putative PIN family toxin of toxin-antitoxin system
VRVVLDTNVLVAGILNPHGPPGRLVDLVFAGDLTLLADDRILSEYDDVLRRSRFGFRTEDVAAVMAFIRLTAEVAPVPPLAVTLPDPDDLPFLEVAVAGEAGLLITGNQTHFAPTVGSHGVRVVSPREALIGLAGDA